MKRWSIPLLLIVAIASILLLVFGVLYFAQWLLFVFCALFLVAGIKALAATERPAPDTAQS